MFSIDTETTGLDLYHGCKPFLVTTCRGTENTFWEWDVNPETREPIIPKGDLKEIDKLFSFNKSEILCFQNPRFDVKGLRTIGLIKEWDWNRVFDTLLAAHLLASGEPHDLTFLSSKYLGVDIERYESDLSVAVNKARGIARKQYPSWKIAIDGDPPSAKGSLWKNDLWLPRAVATAEGYPGDHPWWTVTSTYANSDSAVTLAIAEVVSDLLKEKNLYGLFLERSKSHRVIFDMQERGVTVSQTRLKELYDQYKTESGRCNRVCLAVADEGLETLPKAGSSNALNNTLFNHFGLESPLKTETGKPSTKSAVLEHWEATLDPKTKAHRFVKSLRAKRKRDTAVSYMDSYQRFGIRVNENWLRLHPSLNETGSATLRFSSSNPNEQNVSKKEGFNLRYCFGPLPGREWWSIDYSNIELRIPAYLAQETEMVQLMERPNDPPYFGSYHLLICDTLYPDKFAIHKHEFKNVFKSTLYQWVKNGNFADQYGAIEKEDGTGTADRAYHYPGAQAIIRQRLSKIAGLNQAQIAFAQEHGYVETLPSKGLDRGYPIECEFSRWGKVKPTVPLNYFVQGTAMWCMILAMNRCHEYLLGLPDYHLIMQIHDELVFDFPKRVQPTTVVNLKREACDIRIDRQTQWGNPFVIGRDGTREEVIEKYDKWLNDQPSLLKQLSTLRGKKLGCHCAPLECHGHVLARRAGPVLLNLPKMKKIKQLMEQSGRDIGIPLPAAITYHPENWSKGIDY